MIILILLSAHVRLVDLFHVGEHVESPDSKKLCFYMPKLILKFFNVRLSGENLLFLYKMAGRENGPLRYFLE